MPVSAALALLSLQVCPHAIGHHTVAGHRRWRRDAYQLWVQMLDNPAAGLLTPTATITW